MKTSNTKVRLQDIKAGKVIYISHPVYGIGKLTLTHKPYLTYGTEVSKGVTPSGYVREFSLRDAGIIGGDSYNGRRTFFKLKQAEAWAEKWATQPSFIKSHRKHVELTHGLSMMAWDDFDE